MHEYLKALIRAITDFFASLAARYKAYVERENAKARAEAMGEADGDSDADSDKDSENDGNGDDSRFTV